MAYACPFLNGEVPFNYENTLRLMTDSADDLVDAIRFIKINASIYGVDPDKVADLGWSAGGMSILRTLAQDYPKDKRANVSFAMGATINGQMEDEFGPFINTPPLLLINPLFDEQWVGPQPEPGSDCVRLNVAGGDCTSVQLDTTHSNLNFIGFKDYIKPFLMNKLKL
jgi:hypothetical protein